MAASGNDEEVTVMDTILGDIILEIYETEDKSRSEGNELLKME